MMYTRVSYRQPSVKELPLRLDKPQRSKQQGKFNTAISQNASRYNFEALTKRFSKLTITSPIKDMPYSKNGINRSITSNNPYITSVFTRNISFGINQHLIFSNTNHACFYSTSNSKNETELFSKLLLALPKFEHYGQLDVEQKKLAMCNEIFDSILKKVGISELMPIPDTVQDKWRLLCSLSEQYKNSHPQYEVLSNFNDKNIEKFFTSSIFTQFFIESASENIDKQTTQNRWYLVAPTFPFTGDTIANKDIIDKFVLPRLKNNMIIHDIGCWNGETLLYTAFQACRNGIKLQALHGLDINSYAIECARAFAKHLQIEDQVTFTVGSVHKGLGNQIAHTDAQQSVLIFKLLPYLEEKSIATFIRDLEKRTKEGNIIFLTYAIPSGSNFTKTQQRLKEEPDLFMPVDTVNDKKIYFDTEGRLLHHYITEEQYIEYIKQSKFKQIFSQILHDEDNDRMISILERVR